MFACRIPGQYSPNTHPRTTGLKAQINTLKGLLLRDSLKKSTKPYVIAQLARAYTDLVELQLRIEMKGPPKAVDVAKLNLKGRTRKAEANGFSEVPQVPANAPQSSPGTSKPPAA